LGFEFEEEQKIGIREWGLGNSGNGKHYFRVALSAKPYSQFPYPCSLELELSRKKQILSYLTGQNLSAIIKSGVLTAGRRIDYEQISDIYGKA